MSKNFAVVGIDGNVVKGVFGELTYATYTAAAVKARTYPTWSVWTLEPFAPAEETDIHETNGLSV